MTVEGFATPFAIPLRRPLRAGGTPLTVRHGLLIELRDGDGPVGLGEAAPLPAAATPDWRTEPALRVALETAWLDRAARRAALPLAQYLGGPPRAAIAVNALLDTDAPAACAAQAAALVARGFRCLKLKLDARDLDGTCRRVAAVRAAVGPAIALRGDANGGWTVAEAIAALAALAPFALEYLEQPVRTIAELAAVQRAVSVPLAADEVVTGAAAVAELAAHAAARVVVLKPALLGIRRSLAIAAAARRAGLEVVVTSTLDSSLGIAAAAHVAAAIGTTRACGLATASLLAGDLAAPALRIRDGLLHLPAAPGLGVGLDADALGRWQTEPTQPLADLLATRPTLPAAAPAMDAAAAPATWLARRAITHGAHPALIADDESLDFATLAARVTRTAARLAAAGVARGDRVALLVGPHPIFVELLHALTHLGAVAVPLAPQLASAPLTRLLRTADCDALCYEAAAAPALAALPRAVVARRLAIGAEALPGDVRLDALPAAPDVPGAPPAPEAAHSIIFTSGSSGEPTPIVLSAGNHGWSALGSAAVLGARDDDRWLACLPLHHVGGLSILLRSVVLGVPVVLHERFDPERVNAAIDDAHVTLVSLVPTMLQRVLAARGARPFPPSFRAVLLGGAPAPRALLAECARRAIPLAVTYGMTEAASQIATAPPQRAGLASPGAHALPGTELRIVRDGRPCAAGEVGEIEVRGPTLGRRSGGRPATADADGDWLPTRDLGRLDDDGALTVVGRADDVIISGGENVHPREVEQALESHPAVAEACVFGLPDPTWGEVVCAWVRPAPAADLDPDALLDHTRPLLAACKLPRRLTAVADFPRTPAGKIQRRAVRAAALGEELPLRPAVPSPASEVPSPASKVPSPAGRGTG